MTDVNIDVREAIEKNSYVTSVAELERRGRRQVKVIKSSTIYELIHQAVSNVRHQDAGLGEEERRRLVEQSKAEFDRLLREQEAQRQQLKTLEEANAKYEILVRELKEQNDRQAAKVEELTRQLAAREAAARAASERLQHEESARSETAGRLHEVIRRQEAELQAAAEARRQSEEYRLQIAGLSAEVKAMRENRPVAENLLNELRHLREDLRAVENRNRELEALAAAAPPPALDAGAVEKMLQRQMARITADISAKLASLKYGSDVGSSPEDIKMAIQKIFAAELEKKIDSNIADIKVKEHKSEGIASNLDRLKNLGLGPDGD